MINYLTFILVGGFVFLICQYINIKWKVNTLGIKFSKVLGWKVVFHIYYFPIMAGIILLMYSFIVKSLLAFFVSVAGILGMIIVSWLPGKLKQLAGIKYMGKIESQAEKVGREILNSFLVSGCTKCQEYNMKLIGISPNSRSIHYKCLNCGKELRSAAGNPESRNATEALDALTTLVEKYWRMRGASSFHPPFQLTFDVPPTSLPYEKTSREPIPESVRAEVWRRDMGKCVVCGINQNLQFDHIIPVSRGGATSAKNLQLLCRQCNTKKGNNI